NLTIVDYVIGRATKEKKAVQLEPILRKLCDLSGIERPLGLPIKVGIIFIPKLANRLEEKIGVRLDHQEQATRFGHFRQVPERYRQIGDTMVNAADNKYNVE